MSATGAAGAVSPGAPPAAARPLRLGIDGLNLRVGGGVTHLVELLRAAEPQASGWGEVVVWGGEKLLARLPERPWLRRVRVQAAEKALPVRLAWRAARLAGEARAAGVDLLFVPGAGSGAGFRPYVTMSRNMLPFDLPERNRYGYSPTGVRLKLLTRTQRAAYRRADGTIFLTRTARRAVLARTGPLPGATAVIPHGVTPAFLREPRPQLPLSAYSADRPFRWIYASIVDLYKHQWTVAEAVCRLRDQGLPVALELVGPHYGPARERLLATLARCDPRGETVTWRGGLPHGELPARFHAADAFVFASSCENLPNILLEAMAAGLPVACSDRSVMPEVLGDAGVYFDPEDAASNAAAMRTVMESAELRERIAARAYAKALEHTWARCARDTLDFLARAAAGVR